MKKTGFVFTLFTACFISAAVTLAILGYAVRAAKIRVASQYTEPDYVRYLSSGYAFDTVSSKKNILITVTDGELPVRIHLFTIDEDKDTLDILDIPPDTYVIADGYSGTLRDAFTTPVYKEIISHVLCLRLDGSLSFDAKTFGDAAQMLGVKIRLPDGAYQKGKGSKEIEVLSETGEKIALDGFSYSGGDKQSVRLYRTFLASVFKELEKRGSIDGFSLLMNLIVNRVDTDMSVEDMIGIVNSAKNVKLRKTNIRIAVGSPAKFGDKRVWALDADGVAELLNSCFRVKGIEYSAESLSIPAVDTGEFPYSDLPERVTDILD